MLIRQFINGGRTSTSQSVIIIIIIVIINFTQHPGHSPQSLRQYTRSRREGASSPAVANSLNPLIVPGLDSLVDNNDIVVQVIITLHGYQFIFYCFYYYL